MEEYFSIGEIADLLEIEKSTLRYWDSKGLVRLERDKVNNYRKYSMKTLIDISDIAFYRSLNMPIKNLEKIYDMKLENLEEVLYTTGEGIEKQIDKLKATKININKKQKHIEEYKNIIKSPFEYSKPDMTYIVEADQKDKTYWKTCLYDPYQYTIVINCETQKVIHAVSDTGNDSMNKTVLWSDRDLIRDYVLVIVRIACDDKEDNNIESLLDEIRNRGKSPKIMLGRYLFTAFQMKRYDYYKVWVEVTK